MTTTSPATQWNAREGGGELRSLSEFPCQAYLGKHLHGIGICKQVTRQIGRCRVWVSSYSTSDDFLRGFLLLRKKGLVSEASLLIDAKAAKKLTHLKSLAMSAFDRIFLAMNHSKVMLFENETAKVCVVTSMNQTHGSRAESTVFLADAGVFDEMKKGLMDITNQSMEYGIHGRNTGEGGGTGGSVDPHPGDFRPFGFEW